MKKRKWRKTLFGAVVFALLMLQLEATVFADDTSICVDGSWLTDASQAETQEMIDFLVEPIDGNCPMPLNSYLFSAEAQVSDAGGGKITVYGCTKAATTCDTVKVDLYLQYYDNGAWNYVNNWNYTVKNTSYIARERTVSVTKGRYYRVRCYHAITKNGIKESCTTATDGIKIQ